MLNRRGLLTAIAGIGILGVGGVARAKGPDKHINGHNALGAKLKQNGKHVVGKETVSAEVNDGKVVNMSAGSLPVKKVKSKKKMAGLESSNIRLAANGDIRLAQVDVYYYAYGFDTGLEARRPQGSNRRVANDRLGQWHRVHVKRHAGLGGRT